MSRSALGRGAAVGHAARKPCQGTHQTRGRPTSRRCRPSVTNQRSRASSETGHPTERQPPVIHCRLARIKRDTAMAKRIRALVFCPGLSLSPARQRSPDTSYVGGPGMARRPLFPVPVPQRLAHPRKPARVGLPAFPRSPPRPIPPGICDAELKSLPRQWPRQPRTAAVAIVRRRTVFSEAS